MDRIDLFLDDVRPCPQGWICVRNYNDAIKFLIEHEGEIRRMSFDHDLGLGTKSGYDVACWIEEQVVKTGYVAPERFSVHSQNPVGRDRIKSCCRAIMSKTIQKS